MTGAFTWPYIVSQATYAIERGQAEASQQQLAVASDLSQAFQHVARALRPSVVSVSSVKRVQVNQPRIRRFDSRMPDEFRRFFGDDDCIDRFFTRRRAFGCKSNATVPAVLSSFAAGKFQGSSSWGVCAAQRHDQALSSALLDLQ